jgi:hypothetical protein
MLNIKKIQPLNNYVVTTKDIYTAKDVKNEGLITIRIGSLKEYQRVVAVGPMVRTVKEGDLVCINPRRYAVKKYQEGSLKDGVITENPIISYNFNVIELDHVEHLLITDQDIDFIITSYEEESVVTPDNKLILN